MLGAVGVPIPENNFYHLHSLRDEDGTSETMDPHDILGSLLLADIDLIILGLLTGTLVLDFLGYDPLALVDGFTPVEDNIGLLETRFDEEDVFVFVFPEDVTGLVNLTLLSLFFGFTTTNLSLELLILGQETDTQEKDEKSSQKRQNQNGMEKHGKDKVKSKSKSTQKSQWSKPEPTPKNT
ncbi:hypothetical protein Tco_0214024 [Tanacetum coccineum]